MGIQDCIRDRDLFAIPVQLTYKGQSGFNTLLGGSCSILMILTLLTVCVFELYELALNPQFTSSASSFYKTYNDDNVFELDTN